MEWLFNKKGVASAIVIENDCIYSHQGSFSAWLRGINVYDLSGQHIGWYEDGILYDRNNCIIGFKRDCTGHLPSRPGLCGVPGMPGFSGRPGFPGLSGTPCRPGYGGWSTILLNDYISQ